MSEYAKGGTYQGRVIKWGLAWTKDPAKLDKKKGKTAGINLVVEMEYTHYWDKRSESYVELEQNLFSNGRLCIVKKDGTKNQVILDALNEAFGFDITPQTVNAADMEEIKTITVTGTVKDTSTQGNPYYQTTWIAVNGTEPAGQVKDQAAPVLDLMQSIFEGKTKFDASKVPTTTDEDIP